MKAADLSMTRWIDFNCDMGESTVDPALTLQQDEALMPFISSANIACGFHAGDEETMKKTAALAARYKVAIGAHPSFPDRENFGRKGMQLPFTELYDILTQQVRLMQKITGEIGQTLHHVKPHGALYNMAARSKAMSSVIVLAVKDTDPSLILYGQSGSHLVKASRRIGLQTFSEVFADRTYSDDGYLTSRDKNNALIDDPDKSVGQLMQMIHKGTVTSVTGRMIRVRPETVCLHSDTPKAIELAKKIHATLRQEGISIQCYKS